MYSKIEFIRYDLYTPKTKTNAELSALASASYINLYDCDMSARKTLGLNDYFGNEPVSFDFTLDYDSWLQTNIIDEANDISREFSKYIVRVFDNDVYVFSGVLVLEFFKYQVSKNKLKLKAYDWLLLITKASRYSFNVYFSTNYGFYFQHPFNPTITSESGETTKNLIAINDDLIETTGFARAIIYVAQSLIWTDGFIKDKTLNQLESLATITAYTDIENIIFSREYIQFFTESRQFNKQNSVSKSYTDGYLLHENGNTAYYCFVYFSKNTTNTDTFDLVYNRYGYRNINEISSEYNTFSGEYGSAYMAQCISLVNNAFSRQYASLNNDVNILNSDGTIANYAFLETVTDNDTNIYTKSVDIIDRSGDQNIYFDIFLYCDYVTNGQALNWKKNSELVVSSCLKPACMAGNGCFIITDDNPDEIKFISKYLANENSSVVNIADDDIIDDCELNRISKQSIDASALEMVLDGDFAITLTNRLQTYYNQFFEQVNNKIPFTLSNIFNSYSLNITDKIDILDKAQVVNSIKKESDAFTKIETMNYLMQLLVDELGNIIIDELGNEIIVPSF